MRNNRVEHLLARVFVGVVVFLGIFKLADSLSLYFLPQLRPAVESEFPRETYAVPRPFVMWGGASDPEGRARGNFNELGYRGAVPIMPKPAGEYRIFFVGGSTVMNGAPSLAELVELSFRSNKLPNVRTYNFGVMGSSARQDLARIVFELLDRAPDLIVSYSGGNDILMNYQGDPRPGYPFTFIAYERNPLYLIGTDPTYSVFPLVAYSSALLRYSLREFLRDKLTPLDELRQKVGWNTPNWSDQIADTYVHDVRQTARLLKGVGVQFAVFLQPMVYFKPNRSQAEEGWNFHDLGEHARRCRARIEGALGSEQSMNYFDLSGIFDQFSAPVFRDGIHIEQEFFVPVAKEIYDKIRRFPDGVAEQTH